MGSQAPLGKKDLFNTPGVELPGYIREIARALMRDGKTKSNAIQIAIGVCKNWAAGKGKGVNPDTRAKAAAAIAQWEKAKATARATPNKQDHSNPFDLANSAADVKPRMAMVALEVPAGVIPPVKGGTAPDDMHITLAFLGEDVPDKTFAQAIAYAFDASHRKPLSGTVGGIGVFPPKEPGGKQAVWVPVNIPGVNDLASQFRSLNATEHAYTPHITRAFVEDGDKLPEPVPETPITLTAIIVKRGDQTLRFPLGSGYDDEPPARASAFSRLRAKAVELANKASGKDDKAKKEKKSADQSKLPPGATGWKHGWIPVDSSGKAVGPAQKPQWLKDAEAKHKAAGGRTYEQIQAEKLKNAQESRARKAAAPAKKAAAAKKKAEHEKERAAKKATREREHKAKTAERAAEHKKAERDRQVKAAYKQAQADLKAGRTLSEQQRRVVAYVEAQQRKEAGRLRRVDVKGVDGSKVAAKLPPKQLTPAQQRAKLRHDRAEVARRVAKRKRDARYTVTSYKAGRAPQVRQLSNGDGVYTNVLDFAGHPKGQLAFRYKHGWILINPAIPSRGRMGGGIARMHGHKSGSVTHGHFEDAGGGKKKFVPDRTGGENNPAKLKAAHTKLKGAPADKSKYGLTAAQKDTGGSALKPNPKTPAEVKALSQAANDASATANKTKSLADAQVAAKKHADAFVQAKKAGDLPLAESHKTNAQAWAKKANQIKQAEAASKKAKAAYEAEQKAKAETDKAEAEKAAKKAAQLKAVDLMGEATKLTQIAEKMPETSAPALTAKSQQYKHAADKWQELADHQKANGFTVGPQLQQEISKNLWQAGDYAQKADAKKKALKKANADGADAFDMSEIAETANTVNGHTIAAAEHSGVAQQFHALGMTGDAKMHEEKAAEHAKKALALKAEKEKAAAPKAAPKAETKPDLGPGMQKAAKLEGLAGHIDDVLEEHDFNDAGGYAAWDDYLHASAKYKVDPSPANLKKLAAAQKVLTDEGVTPADMQAKNAKLFKKMGLVASKKTVAQKKAAAPEEKFSPEDFKVSLPGPGMYADGNAVTKAYTAAAAETNPAKKAAMMQAADNAAAAFKAKHGKEFDKSKVELMGGSSPIAPFTPQHGGHTTEHPFWKTAQDEGYEPIPPHVSANGTWKPSDVPGLKSNKGAYTYSGGSYTAINKHLRGGGDPKKGDYAASVAQMDKEFAAVPGLDKDIVTVRKMSNHGPFNPAPPYMDAGGVFEDKGYSSTSKDPGVWSGGVAMQIRIPKGSKVLDLNHTTGSQHSSEQEILLNRGSKYKVISDGPGHGGQGRLIVVELVQ